jgi:hypothetical protein
MTVKRLVPIAVIAGLLFAPATAVAQFDRTWKDWFGHFAVGYSGVQGDLGHILKDGWNISGGATYKPSEWPLGIVMELGYNDFGMTGDALDYFESSGGSGTIWSLTAGGIWAAKTSGKVGFNLQAGVGGYYVKGRLTEPGRICGPICDPFYPWWCWWDCVPGNVVTDSVSSTNFGYNFGAAITFELNNDSVIYLEAKYHWVDTREATKFMPIVVGYRW